MKALLCHLFVVFGILWAGETAHTGHWVHINWANDVFFQTDRYFTNGISVIYTQQFPLHHALDFIHFNHQKKGNVYYHLKLSQDIYTPAEFRTANPYSMDHPFASYLILATHKTTTHPQLRLILNSELQLGIIGKYAGGEHIQNGIHDLLPTSGHVDGWQNQVQTNPVINYGFDLEKGLFRMPMMNINFVALGHIGTLNTFAGTGMKVQVGYVDNYFINLNYQTVNELKVTYFSGVMAKWIGYNAAIQGGVFRHAANINHPEIKRMIYEFDTGLQFSYRWIRIDVGAKLTSPQFEHGAQHRYGYIRLSFNL